MSTVATSSLACCYASPFLCTRAGKYCRPISPSSSVATNRTFHQVLAPTLVPFSFNIGRTKFYPYGHSWLSTNIFQKAKRGLIPTSHIGKIVINRLRTKIYWRYVSTHCFIPESDEVPPVYMLIRAAVVRHFFVSNMASLIAGTQRRTRVGHRTEI